jgi:hypothetical protein
VLSGKLNASEGNALTSKLDAAANQLGKGNSKATISLLGAFINQIEAMMKSERLAQVDGLKLINLANNLIDTVNP